MRSLSLRVFLAIGILIRILLVLYNRCTEIPVRVLVRASYDLQIIKVRSSGRAAIEDVSIRCA